MPMTVPSEHRAWCEPNHFHPTSIRSFKIGSTTAYIFTLAMKSGSFTIALYYLSRNYCHPLGTFADHSEVNLRAVCWLQRRLTVASTSLLLGELNRRAPHLFDQLRAAG
jgi:hypothetical protein